MRTSVQILEALLNRMHLPRNWKAFYQLVTTGDDEWIEIYLGDNKETWKLTIEKIEKEYHHG